MLGTVAGAGGSDEPGRYGPYLPGAHGVPDPRVGELDRHRSKNIILSDKYTKPRDTAGTAVGRVERGLPMLGRIILEAFLKEVALS